jgi:hypothetical protein
MPIELFGWICVALRRMFVVIAARACEQIFACYVRTFVGNMPTYSFILYIFDCSWLVIVAQDLPCWQYYSSALLRSNIAETSVPTIIPAVHL